MTDKPTPALADKPTELALNAVPEPHIVWRVLTAVAVVLAIVGLVVAGLLWQRLNLTQQELARRSQDAGIQAGQALSMAEQNQQLTQTLQARLALTEARVSEVSLQRTQLDELMASLSRSRDDSLLQDLDSSLRLAHQQAQLTGSLTPMVAALKSANERIARAAQPRLNPVQRAIEKDLGRMQIAPLNDVMAALARIDELSRQVDAWPMVHAEPLVRTPVAAAPTPSASAAGAGEWASVVGDWWTERWRWWWQQVGAQFQALVQISRIDAPEPALLSPEQAFFLRENIKLRLLNARLALMARHGDVVRADLQTVQALLQRYFRSDAPAVLQAKAAIDRVAQQADETELPRPDETWAALAKAAGGR
ncbi:MAG: hypothetical protein RL297_399 [Pseudomonadota bacterium]|jgi:uroporphyrin-3 C-methyltransferase